MDRRHRPLFRHRLIAHALTAALLVAACGSDDELATEVSDIDGSGTTLLSPDAETTLPASDETEPADGADDASTFFPDVLEVTSSMDSDGTWTFAVTLSSPYDTPQQYADAWRVLGPDGTEYGFRLLTHDHANEQPFTRSQSGIEIPDDVEVVTVEARDLVNGWGGGTLEHELVP